MSKNQSDERFEGRIAGFGTDSGTRIVVGMWKTSQFGRFADVMIEHSNGHRLLLAPTRDVATYISETYTFDEIQIAPMIWTESLADGINIACGPLTLRMVIGSISPLGRLLRAIPSAFATSPAWLRLIDPIASLLVPGARTAGTAGGGRREFYGVTMARDIHSIEAVLDAAGLGPLRPLSPPVTFGFGSAPARPQLVDVVTTIR
jgi:hypothetical protein